MENSSIDGACRGHRMVYWHYVRQGFFVDFDHCFPNDIQYCNHALCLKMRRWTTDLLLLLLRLPPERWAPKLAMSDPSFPAFPTFAFFGFILCIIPLPWHMQASNGGTCLYMIWTSAACLNLFVNSIVWHNTAIDKSPIWCDVCKFRTHMTLFSCLNSRSFTSNRRHCCCDSCCLPLHQPSTVQDRHHEKRLAFYQSRMRSSSLPLWLLTYVKKRRALMEDLAIGLGLPMIQMALRKLA